jgi:hypothetical protein
MQNEQEIFGSVDPVEEEKQEMIDFGLLEDEKAAEHIDHDIEEVVEATAALESYGKVLTAAGWDGISKQAAKAMLVGLQRIDRITGQKSALVASLEDEAGGDIKRIGHEQSGADEKGLKGRAKELWAKFVELMKRAIAKVKQGALKVKQMFGGAKQKIAKLTESMTSYNPNGPKGGRKFTIPGRTALFAYHEGKYTDTEDLVALSNWVVTEVAPAIKKGITLLSNLKGTENEEQIRAAIPRDIKAPSRHPSNITFSADDDGLTYQVAEEGEQVELTARSRAERNKQLQGCVKVNDAGEKALSDTVLMLADMIDLFDMSWNATMSEGLGVYNALQDSIRYLQKTADTGYEVAQYVAKSNYQILELMAYEDGKVSEAEVSNETFDYKL